MYVAPGFALLRSNGQTFPNLVGEAAHGNTGSHHRGGDLPRHPLSHLDMVVLRFTNYNNGSVETYALLSDQSLQERGTT